MAILADTLSTNVRLKHLHLYSPWSEFLGNLPAESQWTMTIYGHSFSGKSSFMLLFAQMLSKYGDVLYANIEEPLHNHTISNKLKILNIRLRNVYFLEENTPEQMINELKSAKYKYCIIDSVSEFAITPKQQAEVWNMRRQFPNTTFIFVLHGDKSEKTYIGASAMKHKADVVLETREGILKTIKNRFVTNKTTAKYFDIFNRKVIHAKEESKKKSKQK